MSKDMSENMSKDMSKDMSEDVSKDVSEKNVSLNEFGQIDHSGHCRTPNQEKGRGGEDNSDRDRQALDFIRIISPSRPRQILAERMSEFVTNMS